MANGHDVIRNYGFFLELQGERAGYFMEVTRLGTEVDVIEYREGGWLGTALKLPGRTSINDIELSRGVTQSDMLWNWLKSAVDGVVERRDVSIFALHSDGQTPLLSWDLGNAWISKCEISSFNALGNEVLIERLTLVAETLERNASGSA